MKKRRCLFVKAWFNCLVGLATIIGCVVTCMGVNRGIQQVSKQINEFVVKVNPVIKEYRNKQDTLVIRNTIFLVSKDTIVDARRDTVYIQQSASKDVLDKEVKRLDSLMNEIEKRNPGIFY